jgi:hypothetical protein
MILPVVLYGCETWSLILMEERRLKVFENRVLRRIFRSKKGEKCNVREKCMIRSFITCNLRQI